MSWTDDPYRFRRLNWYDQFGSLQLTDTSPVQTAVEPISLQEAKDALRWIDGSIADSQADRRIMALIAPARSTAEDLQHRRFVRAQYDLTYDYWPGRRIRLSPPLFSVDLVQFTDIDGIVHPLVQGVDYVIDKSKLKPLIIAKNNVGWPGYSPSESSSILIRHTSGFLPVDPYWTIGNGSGVKEGMLKLIQFWFNQGISVTKGVGQAEELPYTITQLLNQNAIEIVG